MENAKGSTIALLGGWTGFFAALEEKEPIDQDGRSPKRERK
jgi:hypothetical protein